MKKYLSLSLAAVLALSPAAARASDRLNEVNMELISAPVEEVQMPDYLEYRGKIVEINEGNGYVSILVKEDEEEVYSGMVFHIGEKTLLLDDDTRDFLTIDKLEEGMTVTGYYSRDTIMLMSMPPQLSPNVLVLNSSEEIRGVMISNFDEDLLSGDGGLRLNISEKTVIVDTKGNELDKEEIKGRDLLVFYTIVQLSYPGQTSPDKIIVLDQEEKMEAERQVELLDKINIDGREIVLDRQMYRDEAGVLMIPLRQIGEALGYEVTWDDESRSVELVKGAHWTLVTIGEDSYNFARMHIELGRAPDLRNSTSYVPYDFLQEVLRVEVEVTENGLIKVLQE
ncbi:MAG: copper amine oxidase N-terminal domain-containing protein [Tissierellaceae bacterium]